MKDPQCQLLMAQFEKEDFTAQLKTAVIKNQQVCLKKNKDILTELTVNLDQK